MNHHLDYCGICLMRIRQIAVAGLLATMPLTGAATDALPLHAAVKGADAAALRAAVANAASLDARDNQGRTALTAAIKAGNWDAVSMLLAVGASPDVSDRLGRAPLHYATAAPAKIARLLIMAKADVDSRNAGGITALMLAAGKGRRDIVELLLNAKARLDFKDYQGNSVVDWSRRRDNKKLTAMLEQRLVSSSTTVTTAMGDGFAEDVFVDVHFPAWFETSFLDFREDVEEAVSAGKQGIMIFLSTRRCSYCKAFIQNVLDQPDVRQRVRKSYNVFGLEIFDDSEMTDPEGRSYRVKDFVAANKAAYTPTLIFYGADGRKQLKIVGYYPRDKFGTVLDYLEGQHYRREPLRKYLNRSSKSASTSTKGITVDNHLFSTPPYMLDRRSVAAERPLMVLFERPNCRSCERLHKRVLGDKSIRRLMGEFETVQLDATDTLTLLVTPDGKRISPAQWFEDLELSYSPATVFFDEAGLEVMRLDSETQRFRMEGSLQLVLEKGYQQDAQLQRWRWKKAATLFNLNGED